jgi:hypothetical protein
MISLAKRSRTSCASASPTRSRESSPSGSSYAPTGRDNPAAEVLVATGSVRDDQRPVGTRRSRSSWRAGRTPYGMQTFRCTSALVRDGLIDRETGQDRAERRRRVGSVASFRSPCAMKLSNPANRRHDVSFCHAGAISGAPHFGRMARNVLTGSPVAPIPKEIHRVCRH